MLAAFLSNLRGDLDHVRSGRDAACELHVRVGPAVLVEVEIEWRIGELDAVHGHRHLAAVGVQERPQIQIVGVRLRVAERHLPDVRAVVGRRALGVADAPPLRRPARHAVLVVLPKAGVLAAGIRLFDPGRAAADLQAAVAGDQDVRDRASPLHVAGEPTHRRELLHAGAGRPGASRRGLVAALDGDLRRGVHRDKAHALLCRGRADEVPVAGELEESSTCHTVSDGPTPAVRKQPSSQFGFRLLEARREDHVDLPAVVHRHHDVVACRGALREVEGDVVLRVVVAAENEAQSAASRTSRACWSTGTPVSVRPA